MSTQRYAEKASLAYDVAIKVAVPVLLLVVSAATTVVWDQEKRITVLETRNETILSDVREIKADVKQLLGR